jgi:sucrose-phosphate synthase
MMKPQAQRTQHDMSPTEPRLDGRVVVFGEVLFDHFPDGSKVLGGAPFNVAWHLCGFGADPLVVSAVGDDLDGHEILHRMTGWGISTMAVGRDPAHTTGRVDVAIREGQPSFEIPLDQAWDHIPEPELAPGSPALLYHGTLAARNEDTRALLFDLRSRLDASAFVDLNLRKPWWTRELVDRALAGADWAKVSDTELATLTGALTETTEECASAARSLLNGHEIGTVVVTRGREGALLVPRDGETLATGPGDSRPVVDTVGAGDAFAAVLCYGIVNQWPLQAALDRADAFARDICSIRGATDPDLSLYERHLRPWAAPPAREEVPTHGMHILTLSVHGLVRGTDIELGRDADTGGQVSYVVDQARALAEHPDVARVTLVTRSVRDRNVDDGYQRAEEQLSDHARLIRLPFGPRRYLHKERLWPYLDELLDQLTRWIRTQDHPPDLIHGHYADAGYVGAQLAKLLGVPFVFTGHSLGRVKRVRLLADGLDEETLEERYRIGRRIEAEEQALEVADLVIASTRQEVREQFEAYDHYSPGRMRVIPPGVDLTRFSPPPTSWQTPPIAAELARFLVDPDKPLILAIARADERKNFSGLLHAYGGTPDLRRHANLALVAGNRDDVRTLDPGARRVLDEILRLIDLYDLYGHVAYPKHHEPADVPDLYRYAAQTRGVFVNAALTEPFGLTLLEAAATGLPVVATNDGGPRDILAACEHGVLADPLDHAGLGQAILSALSEEGLWGRWSKNGVSRVHERFSWSSHAREYVAAAQEARAAAQAMPVGRQPARLTRVDRLLVADADGPISDMRGLSDLASEVSRADGTVGFAVVTRRDLDSTLRRLEDAGAPTPDVFVTSSGTAIHYGRHLTRDRSWERRIRYRWDPRAVRGVLSTIRGADPDEAATQPYLLRLRLDGPGAPTPALVRKALRQAGQQVTVLEGADSSIDVLPVRASPSLALRFFCFKWNLEPEQISPLGDPPGADSLLGRFFAQRASDPSDPDPR